MEYKQISSSNLVANQIKNRAGYTLLKIRTIARIVRKLCLQTRTKLYTLFYDREVKKPYAVQWHILVQPRSQGSLLPAQRFGHPRVLGIPIPKSLAFWASPVGDAKNADRFDFA